jgi:hypothetical protein
LFQSSLLQEFRERTEYSRLGNLKPLTRDFTGFKINSKIIMTAVKVLFSAFLMLLTITAYNQGNNERTALGKSYAKKELMAVLSRKTQHNVINNNTVVIKDSMTAISVAEPILFSIYGKNNIIEQRPYEVYLIDNYWIIWRTLTKNFLGGTFLIILNAKDSKILRISHGK